MSILHIHNGDMSADRLRQSTVEGEHLPWREALPEGPAPAGLSEADWLRRRATFLSSLYEMPYYECLDVISHQQARLHALDRYPEVVLWFEHDLFCQLTLLYFLAWFADHPPAGKLSLVCIDRFDGIENFHGLGELSPPQMATLFPERQPVTQAQLSLGKRAWNAYCADTPLPMADLLKEETAALPFVAPALHAHLKRLPSTLNGLSHIRHQALALLSEGPLPFNQLFRAFQESNPVYGLGDLQLITRLEWMAAGDHPLLTMDAPLRVDGIQKPGVLLALTETGQKVLAGEIDDLTLHPADYWLGGIHLKSPDGIWRYDLETGQAVRG